MSLREPSHGRKVTSGLLVVASGGLSALVAALMLIVSGATADSQGLAALHVLIVAPPIATGIYAALHARSARFGRLLTAAGLIWTVTLLTRSPSSLLYSSARIAGWLSIVVLVTLMLVYPDGRLQSRRDRLILTAAALIVLVLYVGTAPLVEAYPTATPWADCGADCPPNAFFVLSSQPPFVDTVLVPVRETLSMLVLLAVSLTLAARLRGGTALRRVTIAPVLVASILSALLILAFVLTRRLSSGAEPAHAIGLVWTLTLPCIAVAYALGLIQRRLFIGNVLSGLSAVLGNSLNPQQVGHVLRRTTGDTAMVVLIRDRGRGRWIREDGTEAAASEVPRPGRRLRQICDGTGPIAAVDFDPGLETDDELIDAIVSLRQASIRETRLKRDLEASLRDLADSRKRIALAADEERRRIERDLHDGAQQRLIALRMRLSLVDDLVQEDPAAASQTIHRLADDVDSTLEEIRSLAQGIYPSLLNDLGVVDALRSAARRSPLDVQVRAEGITRHPREIESAVYFTCLEALQNVVKHAGPEAAARITLWQDGELGFEICDSGAGFDATPASAGTGLRNMRDRVESRGGTLTVLSAPGRGTTIRSSVPLPQATTPPEVPAPVVVPVIGPVVASVALGADGAGREEQPAARRLRGSLVGG
jgi:signal transduction histidine kinase